MNEQKIDIFFSQLPCVWGLDGGKGWLAAQLLWNAKEDGEALMEEFYEEFFGDASAEMRNFFEIAERQRNVNEGDAKWIKYYYNEAGIELFNCDILAEMRRQLILAKAEVSLGSRFEKRINIVSEAFELTELYYKYQTSRKELVNAIAINNKKSKNIQELVCSLVENKNQFLSRSEELISKELHASFESFLSLVQTDPIKASLVSIRKEITSKDWLLYNAYEPELKVSGQWMNQPNQFTSVINNADFRVHPDDWKKRNFLGPKVPNLKGWKIGFRPSQSFKISPCPLSIEEDSSIILDKGLIIENADMFNLYQFCPVLPRQGYILRSQINFKLSLDCRAQYRIDWVDDLGNKFKQERLLQLPSNKSETIANFEIPLIAPNNAVQAKISFLILRQEEGDLIEVDYIDFLSAPEKLDAEMFD